MKHKYGIQHGTLALMVLRTLEILGPLHGYGIARRIEQMSGSVLSLNQGTIHAALLRLEQQGAIASERRLSENNRHARFYRLTRSGYELLNAEERNWKLTAVIIERFLTPRGR